MECLEAHFRVGSLLYFINFNFFHMGGKFHTMTKLTVLFWQAIVPNHDAIWLCIRIFGLFTMETILATAFGRVINILKGESDQLAEAASTIFGGAREGSGGSALYLIALTSK